MRCHNLRPTPACARADAYGDAGRPDKGVPANACVDVELELVSWKKVIMGAWWGRPWARCGAGPVRSCVRGGVRWRERWRER